MKDYKITLQPAKIDYLCYFLGTEEEQKTADERKKARAEELKRVIFAPGFIACEYFNEYGQRRILHRSTRPGVIYQLSYIDADGVPAMHENYINDGTGNPYDVGSIHDERELLQHFIHNSNEKTLNLHILTA